MTRYQNRPATKSKNPVKSIVTASLLGLAFLSSAAAQERTDPAGPALPQPQLTRAQQEAMEELNEAARAYREGHFEEAQLRAEKALALHPANQTAPLFIARTIHAQFKPGDFSATNVATAREAIGAYKKILAGDSRNEEAYKAIAYLYGAIKADDLLRAWLFQRAVDPTFSDEKRAEAFIVLASKDWDCSFKTTELPANHTTTLGPRRSMTVHYTMPKDPGEFEKALKCANEGLELIESAINLSPVSESAWAYKTNLLLELEKLAEMANDPLLKTEYRNQAAAAKRTADEIRIRGSAPNP